MERGKKAGYLKEKFNYWKTAKLFAPGHIVGLLCFLFSLFLFFLFLFFCNAAVVETLAALSARSH